MFRNICGEIGFNKLERSSNKAANQRRGSFVAPFLPQILAQESTINNQQPTDNRSIVLIVRGFASTDGLVSYLI